LFVIFVTTVDIAKIQMNVLIYKRVFSDKA